MNKQAVTGNGRKILFATVPGEGHFNPLTGLAKHLLTLGYDVRWYTSMQYAPKLKKLDIPHYPFVKALEIPADKINEIFPEREKINNKVKKLNYDLINYFTKRGPEYYEDICAIRKSFAFEAVVADVTFTAIPFITDLMKIPVLSIGIIPLVETSKDLPPAGLGLTPAESWLGSLRDSILRFAAKHILFRKANKVMQEILDSYGVRHDQQFLFDLGISKATYYLQSGTPGFEYKRSDLGANIRFIGSLLPYNKKNQQAQWFDERLNRFNRIVLVTQGTVEKDVTKIIVPTLEALKQTDTLVVVTTGGSQTDELRANYQYPNIIIEDFIPFDDIMPYVDVYVTNGGYGGVMLAIENRIPMVTAGVHEGKNEICARVGYFKLGIDLKTETPSAAQVRKAVNTILHNNVYKLNIDQLANEFQQYDANRLFAGYVAEVLASTTSVVVDQRYSEKIY